MGMADVATVLFEKHLKFDASAPHWPDRDRFILSAAHGSMLLYARLSLTADGDMTAGAGAGRRVEGDVGHAGFLHKR